VGQRGLQVTLPSTFRRHEVWSGPCPHPQARGDNVSIDSVERLARALHADIVELLAKFGC
jgi:hypothetical protein